MIGSLFGCFPTFGGAASIGCLMPNLVLMCDSGIYPAREIRDESKYNRTAVVHRQRIPASGRLGMVPRGS